MYWEGTAAVRLYPAHRRGGTPEIRVTLSQAGAVRREIHPRETGCSREAHETPRGNHGKAAGADAEGHGEGNRLAERVVFAPTCHSREGGKPAKSRFISDCFFYVICF